MAPDREARPRLRVAWSVGCAVVLAVVVTACSSPKGTAAVAPAPPTTVSPPTTVDPAEAWETDTKPLVDDILGVVVDLLHPVARHDDPALFVDDCRRGDGLVLRAQASPPSPDEHVQLELVVGLGLLHRAFSEHCITAYDNLALQNDMGSGAGLLARVYEGR